MSTDRGSGGDDKGSCKVNTHPRTTPSVRTFIFPPCNFTIAFTMIDPSPLP